MRPNPPCLILSLLDITTAYFPSTLSQFFLYLTSDVALTGLWIKKAVQSIVLIYDTCFWITCLGICVARLLRGSCLYVQHHKSNVKRPWRWVEEIGPSVEIQHIFEAFCFWFDDRSKITEACMKWHTHSSHVDCTASRQVHMPWINDFAFAAVSLPWERMRQVEDRDVSQSFNISSVLSCNTQNNTLLQHSRAFVSSKMQCM